MVTFYTLHHGDEQRDTADALARRGGRPKVDIGILGLGEGVGDAALPGGSPLRGALRC
jgi:hypothetical protein